MLILPKYFSIITSFITSFVTCKLQNYAKLVAFSHSVFALPFALAALLMAHHLNRLSNVSPFDSAGSGLLYTVALVVVAVLALRTAAMSFNRLVDADIDSRNPRTASREIPCGEVTTGEAKLLVALSIALFLSAAALLGWHCLMLTPLVVAVALGYSYAKRYTTLSHYVLGMALALAPGGAWWILRPQIEAAILLLMFGVLLWVAGFDIIYSCQDEEFDKEEGLYSLPSSVGCGRALCLARITHFLAFSCFLAVYCVYPFSLVYLLGICLSSLLFISQHWILRGNNLQHVSRAFFTYNGLFSIYFLAVVMLAL